MIEHILYFLDPDVVQPDSGIIPQMRVCFTQEKEGDIPSIRGDKFIGIRNCWVNDPAKYDSHRQRTPETMEDARAEWRRYKQRGWVEWKR